MIYKGITIYVSFESCMICMGSIPYKKIDKIFKKKLEIVKLYSNKIIEVLKEELKGEK